jgi:glycosyltransferase involved in cell wall biosynthesis
MPAADDRAPRISVVLPVHDGARTLERALSALFASSFQDFELIVIDDASTDGSAAIAERFPARVLRSPARAGAFACRNRGGDGARGDILLFLDADVVVQADTLAQVERRFRDPGMACLIGLYALEHPNDDLASVYKNTWIRFSYLSAADRVDWFFTAIGALRRDVWMRSKRFGEAFNTRYGGGDIDFGRSLAGDGVSIVLDKDLAVVHQKRFGLAGLLANDFRRAFGWSRLSLRSGRGLSAARGVANVDASFVLGTALSWLLFASALGALAGLVPGIACGALAGLYLALNARFYVYVGRHVTAGRALGSVGIMFLDHMACGAAVVLSVAEWVSGSDWTR